MELPYVEQIKTPPIWILILSTLGFLTLFKLSAALVCWVFVTFLRPPKNLKHYGSWALVTGPTDGIGEAFAFQLARKGLNLILVGRNPDKLKLVSDAITAKFAETRVKSVVFDFSGDLAEGIGRVKEAIGGLDVGILVNNVGATDKKQRYFHEVDEEVLKDIIQVNVEGTSRVTRAVVGGMVARKKGAVVNIGSGSAVAVQSFPLSAVYASTKAYVDQFSRSLYVEYHESGIDVQCQIPMYVATKMVTFMKQSFFVPSPEAYAEASLRWIGYGPRCVPYWRHSVQCFFSRLVPEAAMNAFLLNRALGRRGL